MRNSIFILLILLFVSCDTEEYYPKKRGFIRPELPTKDYQLFDEDCPFSFEYPSYSVISIRPNTECWMDVVYPKLKCELHLTYKALNGNLREYLEQTHKLAYDHHFKASNIETERTSSAEKDVYGVSYFLEGDVASNTQFFLTDSTRHFVRGALYFRSKANPDSLAPYIDFVNEDIRKMVESFEWK
ncbi:MAG: gliding motility lipoprotein GldD [Flavobacteriales bacterium]|nr:gliding motility lipoprotein GldD [Flavobacteriales bacterium]